MATCDEETLLDRGSAPMQGAHPASSSTDVANQEPVSFVRLFQALTAGAATFGLNPSVAPVPPELGSLQKTPSEALAEDALKLRADYERALERLGKEAEARGQGIETKT